MGAIVELAREVLASTGRIVGEVDGEDILVVDGVGAQADLTVYVHVREDDEQLIVYAVRRDHVPSAQQPAMGEFFTRANWRLAIGNFELDLDDGEMRFKVSVDFEGSSPQATMVAQMLRLAVATADIFAAGIERVLAGDEPRAVLEDLAG